MKRAFWLLAGAALALSLVRPVDYHDVWYHLAAGRRMFQTGSILQVEVFSRPFRGLPWLNHEWLYEVVLYGLYRAFGFDGLVALKALLGFGCLLFFALRLRRLSVPWHWIAAALAAARLGLPWQWRDRADLVSLFFLTLLLWLLDSEEGLPRSWPLWLPLMFCVWVNAHGLYFIGLAAIALYAIGQRISGERAWRRAAAAFAGGSLASLVSPQGWRLPLHLARLVLTVEAGPLDEFHAPGLHAFPIFWLCAALFLGAWLAAGRAGRGKPLPGMLFGLFMAAAAARHLRFISFFGLCAGPAVLGLAARLGWLERVDRLWPRRERWLAPGGVLVAAFALAACAARARGGVDASRARSFEAAARFIDANDVAGPYYQDYSLGSYWTWRFGQARPDFIDGRCGALPGCTELFARVVQAQSSPSAWSALLDERGFQAALVRYPFSSRSLSPPLFLSFFPERTWALVYWDDGCLLFVRRTAANAAVIKSSEFRWARPAATESWARQALSRDPALRARWIEELRRNLALHPDSSRARRWLELALSV